jgi:hypothetical protein
MGPRLRRVHKEVVYNQSHRQQRSHDCSATSWYVLADSLLFDTNSCIGLVGGEYLLRGEALALHNANKGDPQYYIGCAQVFLHSTGTLIPENTVSFPGAVSKSDAADSFDLYAQPMKLPYPIPGPPVAKLKSSGQAVSVQMKNGLQPTGCILEVGSNWCGFEVDDYSDERGCWNVSQKLDNIDCTEGRDSCVYLMTYQLRNRGQGLRTC